ncbi:MAG TPA: hypothetical protein VFB75_15065 [Burkholderiales bacterium]|nr:hypothetical protein [Burkholderiales bacterium]
MIVRRLVGDLLGSHAATTAKSHTPTAFVLVLMRPSIGRHLEVFREVMEVVAARDEAAILAAALGASE